MPHAIDIQLETRLIKSGDKLTGLSCGEPAFLPLKIFLERHARTYHEKNLAKTYGTFVGSKLIAYVSLVCGEIVLEGPQYRVNEPGLVYDYKSYPAVKIARLMVDAGYRRQGHKIGSDLVQVTLGTARSIICPVVGCRFVVVDSKKSSVGFYTKQGFTLIDSPDNKSRPEPVMFIDLHKAGP